MAQPHEPIAYLNGQWLPISQARLPLHDAAVVLGATVTDMTRTFGHRPFRLREHLERFYASARTAGLQPPISLPESVQVATELIGRNAQGLGAEQELALVQLLSPGPIPMYTGRPGRAGSGPPTYAMHTFVLPFELWRPLLERGARLVVPPTRQVPAQCWSPQIKCRSRLHWWLADQEARRADQTAMALCLDLYGNVTETSSANLVIVRRGEVISPQAACILWGVSLDTVAQLCQDQGIPFRTQNIQLHDVLRAEEVMVCSTPYCLAPVTQVCGLPIGQGRPGPVFQRLIEAWSRLVGVDIVGQIMGRRPPKR